MEIGINTPVDEKSDRDPDSNFFSLRMPFRPNVLIKNLNFEMTYFNGHY